MCNKVVEMKNLINAPTEDVKKFVSSFEHVFFDIDGVLLVGGQLLPGAVPCVEKLKQLNKKIVAVTNNTAFPIALLEKFLAPFGLTRENIVTPLRSIIEYLKMIRFDRKLVVIGSRNTKETIKEAGFQIVDFQPEKIDENLGCVMADIKATVETTEDVGAVVVDLDLNFQLLQAQRAIVLLSTRDDILFLSGTSDFAIPLGKGIKLLGPKFILDAIEKITERESIKFAKPSEKLKDTLNCDFKITGPNKVLFIGDSVTSDMSFASMCGYQKLLVLTGSTKKEELKSWPYPEEHKPRYYLNDLQEFCAVLEKL